MIHFETEFFQKFRFDKNQIDRYFEAAFRDLKIAREDPFPEVRFTYSYQALIKAGIALIARTGQVKARSVPGHHVKILEKMSVILKNPDVFTIGNAMRMKRNEDLYGGAESVSEKEADDYLAFVEKILKTVKA